MKCKTKECKKVFGNYPYNSIAKQNPGHFEHCANMPPWWWAYVIFEAVDAKYFMRFLMIQMLNTAYDLDKGQLISK